MEEEEGKGKLDQSCICMCILNMECPMINLLLIRNTTLKKLNRGHRTIKNISKYKKKLTGFKNMKKRDWIKTKRVISKKSRQDSKKVFEESVKNINRKKMLLRTWTTQMKVIKISSSSKHYKKKYAS